MIKKLQILTAIVVLSSTGAYADGDKTSVEVGAKTTSNSEGRGEVTGHAEVKTGNAEHGVEVGVKVEASHSTDGKSSQSGEVSLKKDF